MAPTRIVAYTIAAWGHLELFPGIAPRTQWARECLPIRHLCIFRHTFWALRAKGFNHTFGIVSGYFRNFGRISSLGGFPLHNPGREETRQGSYKTTARVAPVDAAFRCSELYYAPMYGRAARQENRITDPEAYRMRRQHRRSLGVLATTCLQWRPPSRRSEQCASSHPENDSERSSSMVM